MSFVILDMEDSNRIQCRLDELDNLSVQISVFRPAMT